MNLIFHEDYHLSLQDCGRKRQIATALILQCSIRKYEININAVSYTHLDVYKRQIIL